MQGATQTLLKICKWENKTVSIIKQKSDGKIYEPAQGMNEVMHESL